MDVKTVKTVAPNILCSITPIPKQFAPEFTDQNVERNLGHLLNHAYFLLCFAPDLLSCIIYCIGFFCLVSVFFYLYRICLVLPSVLIYLFLCICCSFHICSHVMMMDILCICLERWCHIHQKSYHINELMSLDLDTKRYITRLLSCHLRHIGWSDEQCFIWNSENVKVVRSMLIWHLDDD